MIFAAILTALFAGCGGGSTSSDSTAQVTSAPTGSGSTAEEMRGTPTLPSTVSNTGEAAGNPRPSTDAGSTTTEASGGIITTDGTNNGGNNARSGGDVISQIWTSKLVLREDFVMKDASSSSFLALQGATLIGTAGVSAVHTDQNACAVVNSGTNLSTLVGTLVMLV